MALGDLQQMMGLANQSIGLLGQQQAQSNDFFQREFLMRAQLAPLDRSAFVTTTGTTRVSTSEEITFARPLKKTIREELQTETNEWLKDTIEI